MKKIFYYVSVLFIALSCFFGVVGIIFNSDLLSKFLTKSLNLHLAPCLVGGEVAEDFVDPIDDDYGNGFAVYPISDDKKNGSLDLIRYTVHKPVYEAVWQTNSEYWQIDLEYKNGNADLRNIQIYISDGQASGSTKMMNVNDSEFLFDKNYPWNYMIWLKNEVGTVYDSNRNFICYTENYTRKNGKQVIVRIPLEKKELQKFYTAKTTYHYVITGAYSAWSKSGFIADTTSNGFYDILDATSDTSKLQTLQFNEKTFSPIEVKMSGAQKKSINELHKKIESENSTYCITKDLSKEELDNLKNTSLDGKTFDQKLKIAINMFNLNLTDEAFLIFQDLLKENSENAVANAYCGSCIAIKAGKANPMKAMKLVNKSFEYLDKACKLAEGTKDEIEVLQNRAGVASSVPNSIFNKAEVAAKDFERSAELFINLVKKENLSKKDLITIASWYSNACKNYVIAEKETEAIICEQYAEKYLNLYYNK